MAVENNKEEDKERIELDKRGRRKVQRGMEKG
jgi:hypothetical protein